MGITMDNRVSLDSQKYEGFLYLQAVVTPLIVDHHGNLILEVISAKKVNQIRNF
jgi:hypothetical protein